MVRLTVSPEVSKTVNGHGPTGTGGALTSITVQAGNAKIELAVLKVSLTIIIGFGCKLF